MYQDKYNQVDIALFTAEDLQEQLEGLGDELIETRINELVDLLDEKKEILSKEYE